MNTIVEFFYQKESGKLNITCSDRSFDVSRIKDLKIERWVFPFYSEGVRWNGLYEELKDFAGCDNFTLQVESDDDSFEILKYVLKNTSIYLERINNIEVTLVYSEDPFVTRILINGKAFDTSEIQNRSIDEWLFPINVRGIQWKGLFKELENYLNSQSYTIFFIGEQENLKILMDYCPESVSIFYRDPKVSRILNSSESATKKKIENHPQNSVNNVSDSAKKIKDTVGASVSSGVANINAKIEKTVNDERQESQSTNFFRKNFIIICAVLLIVLLMFPFMRFHDEAGSDAYIVESIVTRVSGFGMIFGTGLARINSAFAVGLLIAPIWMVLITYFKPLKKYAKYLIFFAPIIGIVFGFLAFRNIKQINDMMMEVGYGGDVITKTSLGIGFIITLVVYVIVFIQALRQCRK